jgi:hypothetical protein
MHYTKVLVYLEILPRHMHALVVVFAVSLVVVTV